MGGIGTSGLDAWRRSLFRFLDARWPVGRASPRGKRLLAALNAVENNGCVAPSMVSVLATMGTAKNGAMATVRPAAARHDVVAGDAAGRTVVLRGDGRLCRTRQAEFGFCCYLRAEACLCPSISRASQVHLGSTLSEPPSWTLIS